MTVTVWRIIGECRRLMVHHVLRIPWISLRWWIWHWRHFLEGRAIHTPIPALPLLPPSASTDNRIKDTIEYWIEFSPQTSRGSLSAVSTPIFASKYSLESSRRDLHNTLLCTVLQSQNFSQKSSTFFRDWIIEFPFFLFLRRILHFFCECLMIFFRISRQIPEKSDVCRFSIKFAKTNSKIAEIFEICENYSILFNRVLRRGLLDERERRRAGPRQQRDAAAGGTLRGTRE